jgi:hypothetical protein
MRETFEKSLDYLIETFDKMNSETNNFFGNDKKYSELSLADIKNLKNEYNLEMKYERDNNILQHSFNLVYENGGFGLDPSFDYWWKEISTIIRVNIFEKISMYFFQNLLNCIYGLSY